MTDFDNVPRTLFEQGVFREFDEADFTERLTFRTLQQCTGTKHSHKEGSTAAFKHLFESALGELEKLRHEVGAELQDKEEVLTQVQTTAQEDLEDVQEAVQQLLTEVKTTEGHISAVSNSVLVGERYTDIQNHIHRAEDALELMDRFAAFGSIGAEEGAMDKILEPLRAAAKKKREKALIAEQKWQERHTARGDGEEGDEEGVAEEEEAADEAEMEALAAIDEEFSLPTIFCVVVDKCFVAKEVQKLLLLTNGMKYSENKPAVKHLRRYANWLQNELIEDCFCYLDCYESYCSYLQHAPTPKRAHKPNPTPNGGPTPDASPNPSPHPSPNPKTKPNPSSEPAPNPTGPSNPTNPADSTNPTDHTNPANPTNPAPNPERNSLCEGSQPFCPVNTAHGQWLLKKLENIPDSVSALGNPDALLSRYINKCFMEINAQLPDNMDDITAKDVKNSLNFMAAKCMSEKDLVLSVFQFHGLALMHRMLARYAEETVSQLVEGVLTRYVPPSGLLSVTADVSTAAKMAASAIGTTYSKDHQQAEKEKEKQRLTLVTYANSIACIEEFLPMFHDLYMTCKSFVAQVSPYAGGGQQWLHQAVDSHFQSWRSTYMQWEILHLRMYSFHRIANSHADEDLSPYASYSTLVYLTKAAEAALDRCAVLSLPAQAASNLSTISLILIEYTCVYIKVCIEASLNHMKEGLKRPTSHYGPVDLMKSDVDIGARNTQLASETPHVGCLYVVSWANQSMVKLERHTKQKLEPMLKHLGVVDAGPLLGRKHTLQQAVEVQISEALNLSCKMMAHHCLAVLQASQHRNDFNYNDKKGATPGEFGCSLACRRVESQIEAYVMEINGNLDGKNRVLFIQAFGGMLFDGICAHFRSYQINDVGSLVLRADISRYMQCMDVADVASVRTLFRSLKYLSDLFIVTKSYLSQFLAEGPEPPFTRAHVIDFLKQRADLSGWDVQQLKLGMGRL